MPRSVGLGLQRIGWQCQTTSGCMRRMCLDTPYASATSQQARLHRSLWLRLYFHRWMMKSCASTARDVLHPPLRDSAWRWLAQVHLHEPRGFHETPKWSGAETKFRLLCRWVRRLEDVLAPQDSSCPGYRTKRPSAVCSWRKSGSYCRGALDLAKSNGIVPVT